jgi:putative SOS response-associated peptidase YedK
MCGRYLVVEDETYEEELRNLVSEISDKYRESAAASGEIFPTNNIPVLYSHNGSIVLSAAKWGFPNFRNSGVIINARAESLAEKPMFRNAFLSKRCAVPANGYYEWLTREDKIKAKYLIRVKDKKLFFMAGLYNIFSDKNGVPYAAVTIITTGANPDVSFIHNRMPAILQDEAVRPWLDSFNRDIDQLQGFLVPYRAGGLVFEAA